MRETFLVIQVADKRCAIPAAVIQEIVHVAAMGRLAGQPPILYGFLNFHGQTVPVLSMRALLGEEPAEPDLYAPMIVVREGARPIVLLADSVHETLVMESVAMEPMEESRSLNGCAVGSFQSPEGPVLVLSPERLLLAKEKECIAALRARMDARLLEAEGAGE